MGGKKGNHFCVNWKDSSEQKVIISILKTISSAYDKCRKRAVTIYLFQTFCSACINTLHFRVGVSIIFGMHSFIILIKSHKRWERSFSILKSMFKFDFYECLSVDGRGRKMRRITTRHMLLVKRWMSIFLFLTLLKMTCTKRKQKVYSKNEIALVMIWWWWCGRRWWRHTVIDSTQSPILFRLFDIDIEIKQYKERRNWNKDEKNFHQMVVITHIYFTMKIAAMHIS